MKFFLISLLATSASAFQLAPAATARSSAIYSEVTEEAVEAAPAFPTVNGRSFVVLGCENITMAPVFRCYVDLNFFSSARVRFFANNWRL